MEFARTTQLENDRSIEGHIFEATMRQFTRLSAAYEFLFFFLIS